MSLLLPICRWTKTADELFLTKYIMPNIKTLGIVKDPFGKNGEPQFIGATLPLDGYGIINLSLSDDGKVLIGQLKGGFSANLMDSFQQKPQQSHAWKVDAIPMSELTSKIKAALLCVSLAVCGGGGSNSSDSAPAAGNTNPAGTPAPAAGTRPAFSYDETARFNGPTNITADASGNLFVIDSGNKSIRKVAVNGEVSTLPTTLNSPSGLEIDTAGNLYTNDAGVIRKIGPNGSGTTLANVPASAWWMTIDQAGSLYLLDHDYTAKTGAIIKVTQDGTVTTVFSGAPLNDQNRGIARCSWQPLRRWRRHNPAISRLRAPTEFARGFNLIQDMEFDSASNLYVAQFMMAGASTASCRQYGLCSPKPLPKPLKVQP